MGVGVGVGVAVSVGVCVGVGVFVGVLVEVGVFVGVGVCVGVCEAVGVCVGVSVDVAVKVGVSVGVGVKVFVDCGVGDGVSVEVGVKVGRQLSLSSHGLQVYEVSGAGFPHPHPRSTSPATGHFTSSSGLPASCACGAIRTGTPVRTRVMQATASTRRMRENRRDAILNNLPLSFGLPMGNSAFSASAFSLWHLSL